MELGTYGEIVGTAAAGDYFGAESETATTPTSSSWTRSTKFGCLFDSHAPPVCSGLLPLLFPPPLLLLLSHLPPPPPPPPLPPPSATPTPSCSVELRGAGSAAVLRCALSGEQAVVCHIDIYQHVRVLTTLSQAHTHRSSDSKSQLPLLLRLRLLCCCFPLRPAVRSGVSNGCGRCSVVLCCVVLCCVVLCCVVLCCVVRLLDIA